MMTEQSTYQVEELVLNLSTQEIFLGHNLVSSDSTFFKVLVDWVQEINLLIPRKKIEELAGGPTRAIEIVRELQRQLGSERAITVLREGYQLEYFWLRSHTHTAYIMAGGRS